MRESPICVESQAKKKKKKGTCLDVTPRKLISNLRLDSDGKESDNDNIVIQVILMKMKLM